MGGLTWVGKCCEKVGPADWAKLIFLFSSMRARSFSPTSEFTGSSIEAKCKPVKKYKQTREKRTSEPVKSPYGVGRYCDMAVSPTRSHLLWCSTNRNLVTLPCDWLNVWKNLNFQVRVSLVLYFRISIYGQYGTSHSAWFFSHPLGGVKGDFLVQGSDGGGTFCLHFWNLHKIWI